MKKLTTEEFINKAKEIHGDKYDYSNVEYKGSKMKVCIICPKHGEFWQKPSKHLQGQGCPKCVNKNITTEEFIIKAKEIHGNKYNYSKVNYLNNHTKVCIICLKHGEFFLTPSEHINNVYGCPICSGNLITTESFIERAKKIHGDKYDYSKVNYVDSKTKVCIICPKHGEFWQVPSNHLQGQGCKKCYICEKSLLTEDFINKAKEIHGNKYDYSKVEYVNAKIPVCIICPEHGEFWQKPENHLYTLSGCQKCSLKNNKSEQILLNKLKSDGFNVEYQKHFTWLGKQSLDIYLPDYNIAIEYQGRQHFKPIKKFGGKEGFEKTKFNDYVKYDLCNKNNLKLFYFTFDKRDLPSSYLNDVITDYKKLIIYIMDGVIKK